jgi:hypothetical protein
MGPTDWLDGVDITISGCDAEGTTNYLNVRGAEAFEKEGGYALLGTDMRDCHPGATRQLFEDLLASRQLQAYTIEKQGKRKLVYQVPVVREGVFQGYVELVLPLPETLPHLVRG